MSLLAGALISGALGLGKAILGGVQSAKGNKQMNNLLANRPIATVQEGYMNAYNEAKRRAAGQMPGTDLYKDMYAEATARAMTGAERGAISSNVYQGAVESAQDKELQALQQLAQMGVQYKMQTSQQLEAAQNRMGDVQQDVWNYNTAMPWDIKANMANEKRQAGAQNLWGGVNDMASSAMNYAGTKYYGELMKELQSNAKPFTSLNVSAPMTNYNPSTALVNTASNLLRKNQDNMTPYEKRLKQLQEEYGITPA